MVLSFFFPCSCSFLQFLSFAMVHSTLSKQFRRHSHDYGKKAFFCILYSVSLLCYLLLPAQSLQFLLLNILISGNPMKELSFYRMEAILFLPFRKIHVFLSTLLHTPKVAAKPARYTLPAKILCIPLPCTEFFHTTGAPHLQ